MKAYGLFPFDPYIHIRFIRKYLYLVLSVVLISHHCCTCYCCGQYLSQSRPIPWSNITQQQVKVELTVMFVIKYWRSLLAFKNAYEFKSTKVHFHIYIFFMNAVV